MSPIDELCPVRDFNIDQMRPSKPTVYDYLNILADLDIESRIQFATRKELLQNNLIILCIDPINVRKTRAPEVLAVKEQHLADHSFAACRFNIPITFSKECCEKQRRITIPYSRHLDSLIAAYDKILYLESRATRMLTISFLIFSNTSEDHVQK